MAESDPLIFYAPNPNLYEKLKRNLGPDPAIRLSYTVCTKLVVQQYRGPDLLFFFIRIQLFMKSLRGNLARIQPFVCHTLHAQKVLSNSIAESDLLFFYPVPNLYVVHFCIRTEYITKTFIIYSM